MDAATAWMMTIFSVLDSLANAGAALIPFAIWQRTRMTGFALVGASFALAALMGLSSAPVYAAAGGSPAVLVAWRLLALALTLLAATGFWMIWRALRAPTPATTATGA